ncbi:hypothetical protein CCACVL1_08556 [Corchorus capsularis]|uniref:Uncharacterized protein n=1 Tax=Corchorus capsularis TaxID=210143 RepID=A0A1R3IZS1_COCAP|nr:hypothetical protein CCACVL1_08556 [Corchorus capsularis]
MSSTDSPSNSKSVLLPLAEHFGNRDYIPYFALARDYESVDVTKGVNYASGWAGIRDESGQRLFHPYHLFYMEAVSAIVGSLAGKAVDYTISPIARQVDGEGEVVKAESICFPKLKHLELSTLKKLESFSSSGNYTFQFPSLQTVQLNDCPNMKMFSPADPSTPSLFKVIFGPIFGGKERYSRSLNRAVQQMFEKQESEAKDDKENSEIKDEEDLTSPEH